MKIHLPEHHIADVAHIGLRDIPLAYIDTKDTTYEATFKLEEDFATDDKKALVPYQVFSNSNTIMFNEDGSVHQMSTDDYRRQGSKFLYDPKGDKAFTKFTPEKFEAQVLLQRAMTYSTDKRYDLSVGAIEMSENNETPFLDKLIKAFGDAYRRGACPPNVVVNGGAQNSASLTYHLDDKNFTNDFIFIQSDGKDFSGLDLDKVLAKHLNVWISASAWGDNMIINNVKDDDTDFSNIEIDKKEKTVSYKKYDTNIVGHLSLIYDGNKGMREKQPKYIFDTTKLNDKFSTSDYAISYPYLDVMVMEKLDHSGYIVVTPDSFIDNITNNTEVMYDVMMYVYLNGYMKLTSEPEWITNEPVDYMAYSYAPLNKYHPDINLHKMINDSGYPIGDQYHVINFLAESVYSPRDSVPDNISFLNLDPQGNMMFRKVGTYNTDPVKPDGYISYLTSAGEVLYYNDSNKIYMMTTKVSLASQFNSDNVVVVAGPLRDSAKRIYIPTAQALTIPDIKLNWFLCVNSGEQDVYSNYSLVESGKYDAKKDGYKVAEIRVIPHFHIHTVDVRVRGGGLAANEPDNFNMIDIGNVYGKPYRVGSTLIIRLPKRLADYQDHIIEAVNKHMTAGDYPIIIFED